MMAKIFVIANPSSGSGQAKDITSYIKDQYLKQDINPDTHLTESEDDIIKFAKQASDEKADKVFLIGGDGTISIYMNAIKDFDYKPEVAIIPTGTMNNVARALTIPLDQQEAVDALIDGEPYLADMGMINDEVFTSTISAGRLPESAYQVSEEDKEQFGSLSYFISGIRSMGDEESYEYKIEVDGQTIESKLDLIVIGISDTIIGLPDFFQGASFNDRKLHFFGLEDTSMINKVFELSKLLADRDKLEESEDAESYMIAFEEMTIEMVNKSSHLTVDGEKGPKFPVHIKVLPEFVNLTVPEDFE